jgi:hypothetical protein
MDSSIERVAKPASGLSTNHLSPTRMPRIIKKVDLGAAANYGKDQGNASPIQVQPTNLMSSPIKQPTSRNKSDILNDIFDSQNDNKGTGTLLR